MTLFLKESTAVTLAIGPFVDSTDGVTAETTLTLSQADFRLSKNGGAFAQKNESTSGTHMENGYYSVPFNTTDTGTLGVLKIAITESGALPVWIDCMVVPANVWDSLFGADKLQVHADEITNGLITAAAIATGAIDADALATDAVTEIQSGLPTAATIADAVWDEPLTQPSGVFAWAGNFRNVLNWLGALSRNKVISTATLETLRNDADNADIATAVVSDDGSTFTREEWT